MIITNKQIITENKAFDVFFQLLIDSYTETFHDFNKNLETFHDIEIKNEKIAKMSFLLMLAMLEIECIRNIHSDEFANKLYHHFIENISETVEEKYNEIQAERYKNIIHNEIIDYKQKYYSSLKKNKKNPCYSLLEDVIDKHLHTSFEDHTNKIYLEETNTINPIITKISNNFLTDSIYISKRLFSEYEIK